MFSSSVHAKISLIALIAVAIIISGIDAYRPHRIIEGEDAAANEFPWMARLNVTDGNGVNHDCGGAIISPRHILTAAHCLHSLTLNSVWTGFHIRDFNIAVQSKPAQIIVHPEYKWISKNGLSYTENDLGIVVLDGDLKLAENQNVIPLPNKETTVGTRAILPGWGFTDLSQQNRATILQKSPINIRPIEECPIHLSELLCGRSPPHATPCNGDSGSPLVADDRVIGILSTSWCLPGRETMFVSVFHHLAWITLKIEESSVQNN